YNTQFPAKCDWRIIDIPTFDDGAAPFKEFVDATSLLAVGSASRDNPEKALEVLKFFYSDENMAEMYEHSLYIPFRGEALALATREPEMVGFAAFASVPNNVLILPMPDTIVEIEGSSYRETVFEIFSNPTGDAAAVLADLDNRFNTALAKLDANRVEQFRAPANRNARR
ncbi:MAG: hypothetical protein FWH00_04710, partial [Oscillospiraceae bacterium]|nr:hypothetical protein [Oscillospiraceae bacterium]